ncbi:putative MFS family arabinose efflux permease [Elusimicrobium simillimum]|uniref:MFS transporter n=1 Tax=Elusimicrobium simillimum TaxID=3143438 RepID=UPI003C6FF0B4
MRHLIKRKEIPLIRLLSMEGCTAMARYTLVLVLPWYVLQISGGAVALGVLSFAMMVPAIFGSYIGGNIIERLGARKTILLSDLCQMLCTIVIFFCVTYSFIPFYFLVMMAFLSAFFYAPGKVARGAVIPVYARYAKVSPHKAFGFREAVSGTAAIMGPLTGGFIIAAFGVGSAVLYSAVFFLLAVLLCLQMIQRRERALKFKSKSTFKKTIIYVLRRPHLYLAILFTLPFFIIYTAWESVVLPSYVNLYGYGSVFLGMLESAFGIGILLGALGYAVYGKKVKFKTMLILNYAAYILPIAIFLLTINKPVVLFASFICGAPFGAYAAMMTTFLTINTPEYMRAKILAFYISLTAIVDAVGIWVTSLLIHRSGFEYSMQLLAAVFILALCAATLIEIKPHPVRFRKR